MIIVGQNTQQVATSGLNPPGPGTMHALMLVTMLSSRPRLQSATAEHSCQGAGAWTCRLQSSSFPLPLPYARLRHSDPWTVNSWKWIGSVVTYKILTLVKKYLPVSFKPICKGSGIQRGGAAGAREARGHDMMLRGAKLTEQQYKDCNNALSRAGVAP